MRNRMVTDYSSVFARSLHDWRIMLPTMTSYMIVAQTAIDLWNIPVMEYEMYRGRQGYRTDYCAENVKFLKLRTALSIAELRARGVEVDDVFELER